MVYFLVRMSNKNDLSHIEQHIGESASNRIARHSVYMISSNLVAKVLYFAFFILTANFLGDEKFGKVEYYFTLAMIFTVVADLGLEFYSIREIARYRDQIDTIFAGFLGFRLTFLLLSAIILFLFIRTANPETTPVETTLTVLLLILFSLGDCSGHS